MSGVNKVILVGNLGKDPEVRHLENGAVVANVTLATTESYKDKTGNRVDITEWHDLEMWDGLAKIAEQYLSKGKTIYVEGRIKSDTWQDEQGNNRKRTKIRVQNMTMIGGRGNTEAGGAPAGNSQGSNTMSAPSTPPPVMTQEETDDLPF
ncbi:single-stranded DNA-binding protein [Cytophagales bacterium LB-30]|uniref:Single-stranded DNA-binding protein n=1 Tax=Shiella aurantiaca TaxID=3058365 RepID=A0ABT8F5D7_9BACT|nr:single-stranded DNA-binding protein [Shiella aurantiaca]MDN4165670.1 single-stranded DNA-binding protein [Shiella aurantiaca]